MANKPYDQFVRELLAATGDDRGQPGRGLVPRVQGAAAAARRRGAALPGRADACAQCHHHPFEQWSQDDYYGLAAFFSRVGRKPTATPGRGRDLPQARHGPTARTRRPKLAVKPAVLGAPAAGDRPGRGPAVEAGRLDGRQDEPVLRAVAGEPLLEALLRARPRRARGRHPRDEPGDESRAAGRPGQSLRRQRLRPEGRGPRDHPVAARTS